MNKHALCTRSDVINETDLNVYGEVFNRYIDVLVQINGALLKTSFNEALHWKRNILIFAGNHKSM